MKDLAYGSLIYFGSYLIPIGYLISTLFRGPARKPLLIGIAIHTFWNLAVWGFVYYSWWVGYSEYYYGWALLVPVNFISLLYYVGAIIFSGKKNAEHKDEKAA